MLVYRIYKYRSVTFIFHMKKIYNVRKT